MTANEIFPELRNKLWWYFIDLRLRYALALLFVGLVLVNHPIGKLLLLFGLAWIAGSVFLNRSRPSEAEVDEHFSQDVDSVIKEAERQFRVEDQDLQVKPLVLVGPVERDIPEYYQFLSGPRTGKDGRHRSPITRVVVLLPMETHLAIYSCQVDLLRKRTSQVIVEEHNYKDVVSVSLERCSGSSAVKYFDGSAPLESQVLSLELANGKKLAFPVSERRAGEGSEDGVELTGTERTMRAIQTLIRDRR